MSITKKRLRIYLGGPINKCSDSEARDWREAAKERLGQKFELIDPMVRDYRGQESAKFLEIMEGDERDFGSCDIGLFYTPKPSDGTSMEIRDMYKWLEKTVLIVCPQEKPSPWILGNNDQLFKDFEEAFEFLELAY